MKKKLPKYGDGGRLLLELLGTIGNVGTDLAGLGNISENSSANMQNDFLKQINKGSDQYLSPMGSAGSTATMGMLAPQLSSIMSAGKSSPPIKETIDNPEAPISRQNSIDPRLIQGFANGGIIEMPEGSGETDTIPTDGQGNPSSISGQKTIAMTDSGEVIWNGYVFSDKLGFAPKAKNILKRYKLRLGDDFSGRDRVSKTQMDRELADLADDQERQKQDEGLTESSEGYAMGGGIHIKESKVGTFTAAANRRGMGVQEFASHVMANKDRYTPAMVKKANFAKNASKWNHEYGGDLQGFYNGGNMNELVDDEGLTGSDLAWKLQQEAMKRKNGIITYQGRDNVPTNPLVGLGGVDTTTIAPPVTIPVNTKRLVKPQLMQNNDGIGGQSALALGMDLALDNPRIRNSQVSKLSGYPSPVPYYDNTAELTAESTIKNPYVKPKFTMGADEWALAGNLASTALRGVNLMASKQKDFTPASYTPELLNLEEERNRLQSQAMTSRRSLMNRYRNSRAAQIAGITGVDEQLAQGLAGSYMRESGVNVPTINRQREFSASSQDKMRELEAQESGAQATMIDRMLSDVGASVSGYYTDKAKRKQEKSMYDIMIQGSMYTPILDASGQTIGYKIKGSK